MSLANMASNTEPCGLFVTEKPLAIDLFCGLFGWSEGLIAEGFRVVGFDIEDMHANFNVPRRPEFQLVIQDVLTLHGSQFRDAALIVASPPCQEFSYMSMPWSLAKAKAAAIRADTTGAARAELTKLFDACFRIQREASDAAGRTIPMVVENVCGAQGWVGRARWSYGSFYLWGNVPALMPITLGRGAMKAGIAHRSNGATNFHGYKSSGMNWSDRTIKGQDFTRIAGKQAALADGKKCGGGWFGAGNDTSLMRQHSSKSPGRKAASAMIAKIPLPLSRHIAATYRP